MTLGLSVPTGEASQHEPHIPSSASPHGPEARINTSAEPRMEDMQTQMAAFTFGEPGRSLQLAARAGSPRRDDLEIQGTDAEEDIGQIRSDFKFGTCPSGPSVAADPSASTARVESNNGFSRDNAPRLPPASNSGRASTVPRSPIPSYSLAAPIVPPASDALTATPTIEYGAFEYPSIPATGPSPTDAVSASAPPQASASGSGSGSLSGPSSPSRPYRPLRSARSSLEAPVPPFAGATYPLGESHRRNSIIARPYGFGGAASVSVPSSARHTPTPSLSTSRAASAYLPPQAKRSITCGDIATLPVGGRRPSILHSATMAVGEDVVGLPIAQAPVLTTQKSGYTIDLEAGSENGEGTEEMLGGGMHTGRIPADQAPSRPELHHASSSSSSTATITPTSLLSQIHPQVQAQRRRTSLMFQPKTLPSPIPPSLLARRGSLPFGSLSSASSSSAREKAELFRASFSGLQTYGGVRDVTSHRLYHRKESLVAVDSGAAGQRGGSQSGVVIEGARKERTTASGEREEAAGRQRGERCDGDKVALQVGPGLVAVPDTGGHPKEAGSAHETVADTYTPGTAGKSPIQERQGTKLRRSSVPHSLRSTIRSPAQYLSGPQSPTNPSQSSPIEPYHVRATAQGPHQNHRTQHQPVDKDLERAEIRRAIRDRYVSYDRAYRPAFSRGLSSSDESDELGLDEGGPHAKVAGGDTDLLSPVDRQRRGEREGEGDDEGEGNGEGEGGGDTDDVESLPTPGLETALDLGMGVSPIPGGPGGTRRGMIKVRGTESDDEEDGLSGDPTIRPSADTSGRIHGLDKVNDVERPVMEERRSDETVKGVAAAGEAVL